MAKLNVLPNVGEEYHFFDDGKISPSRHYIAKVEDVVSIRQAKGSRFLHYYKKKDKGILNSLYDIWRSESKEHYWLFAEETDVFLMCSIPKYDENMVWFARTRNGGWFSMNVQNCLQGGELDVDGSIYEYAKELFDDYHWYGWYDEEIKLNSYERNN